jgi:hypothetical protein
MKKPRGASCGKYIYATWDTRFLLTLPLHISVIHVLRIRDDWSIGRMLALFQAGDTDTFM